MVKGKSENGLECHQIHACDQGRQDGQWPIDKAALGEPFSRAEYEKRENGDGKSGQRADHVCVVVEEGGSNNRRLENVVSPLGSPL